MPSQAPSYSRSRKTSSSRSSSFPRAGEGDVGHSSTIAADRELHPRPHDEGSFPSAAGRPGAQHADQRDPLRFSMRRRRHDRKKANPTDRSLPGTPSKVDRLPERLAPNGYRHQPLPRSRRPLPPRLRSGGISLARATRPRGSRGERISRLRDGKRGTGSCRAGSGPRRRRRS